MLSIASSVPLNAIYAGSVSFFIAMLLVMTKQWHGHATMDPLVGIQKSHLAPTPRVGGVAILAGLIVGCIYAQGDGQSLLWHLIVAGLPAFAFGLLEDVTKRVGVRTRLLATMACGVLAWQLTGFSITNVNVPGFDWLLSFTLISVAFTAFAVGGIANAINIIDGFNGLAAGTVLVILTAFGLIAESLGDAELARACLILAGAVTGFVLLNWPFGKLFLGDGGAYFVGFAIAWLSVLLARHPGISPWAPLVVCGYPILEVMFSILRRHRRNLSPGAADRLHLHSLIKRRLVRRLLPGSGRLLRNSVTGAIMWGAALLPALIGARWSDNTPALIAGLAVCAGLYSIAYARLTQFRWCWPATGNTGLDEGRFRTVNPALESSPAPTEGGEQRTSPLRISVITATWNSAGTIGAALDSIAAQTHPHIEQVWVDGCSTDGTVEILSERLRSTPAATLVSEPDKGIYDALNKGLRRATGDVVGFLHADDVLASPDCFARIAAAFDDPAVKAVYGDLEYVTSNDTSSVVRHWRAGVFERLKLAQGWMPPHPTLYLRREIYERHGLFDTSFRIAADYDFVLRVFKERTLNPVYLPTVLVKMRLGGISNRSISNIVAKSREDLRALRRNGIGSYGSLAWKNISKIPQFRKAVTGKLLARTRNPHAPVLRLILPAKHEPSAREVRPVEQNPLQD